MARLTPEEEAQVIREFCDFTGRESAGCRVRYREREDGRTEYEVVDDRGHGDGSGEWTIIFDQPPMGSGPCHLCGWHDGLRFGNVLITCECGAGAEICEECHKNKTPCYEKERLVVENPKLDYGLAHWEQGEDGLYKP